MTNSEYHARAEISKSDLSLLANETPYALKMKKDGLYKNEASASLNLGSAVHKLVLEPYDFEKEFAVEPTCDKRTKNGKAKYEAFENENQGKIILKADEFEKAKAISESILQMKQTAKFLKDGTAEQSYFSELCGIKVKCRPDFYNENLGLLIDLKTTSNPKKYEFTKSVANFAYDMQVAFYTDILESLGKKVNSTLIIAVKNKEPYSVAFYEIKKNSNAFLSGREYYQKLLKIWRECVEKNEYPNFEYTTENEKKVIVQEITDLPPYELYKRAEI